MKNFITKCIFSNRSIVSYDCTIQEQGIILCEMNVVVSRNNDVDVDYINHGALSEDIHIVERMCKIRAKKIFDGNKILGLF